MLFYILEAQVELTETCRRAGVRAAHCSQLQPAAARLNRRGPGTRRCQSHSDGAAASLRSQQPASLTL